jgi:signal transduction histidine kinase
MLGRANPDQPEVAISVDGTVRRLDPQSELALFRIVQEAWSNIRRHAQARHARFTFDYTRNALVVTMQDDGQGFSTPVGGHTGWGLVGMRERVGLYGGSLEAGRRQEGGFVVRVLMPWGSAVA